ncbi:hypothetical protein [Spirillospora sp. NPDC047279]|uniref:hypothetical protein n=1 Tax=Spirillospora sp. NPDC047279 TaxID=3155478 RepID=UPI0033E24902
MREQDEEEFRPSAFTWAWALWIVFFLLVEGYALLRKRKGDTFSEHWWTLFHVHSKVPKSIRLVLVVLQLAFGTWLVGHLAFGWWATE